MNGLNSTVAIADAFLGLTKNVNVEPFLHGSALTGGR
jgi:hypothetical protein